MLKKKCLKNKELSYDERRKFFIEHSMENELVFNAMYNLQLKGKENVERIDNLIKNTEEIIEKQKSKQERLDELFAEKRKLRKELKIC